MPKCALLALVSLFLACRPLAPPAPTPIPITTPPVGEAACPWVRSLTSREPPQQPFAFAAERVAVARIVDGDTIALADGRRVRYIGVDTPETEGRRDPYGPEAKESNRRLVEGKEVWLLHDVSETDRFGRHLRYVFADGLFVNAELIREGYARVAVFPPDTRYIPCFRELEREAREGRRGLWALEEP